MVQRPLLIVVSISTVYYILWIDFKPKNERVGEREGGPAGFAEPFFFGG
jgi:hypothetical protein